VPDTGSVNIESVIDVSVTVVVDLVASLDRVRSNRPVGIVAVATIRNVALRLTPRRDPSCHIAESIGIVIRIPILPIQTRVVDRTVTVLILVVTTDFRGFRVDARVRLIAIACASSETVTIAVIVDQPVAVVVLSVAEFDRIRMNGRVHIVTISGACTDAVSIGVKRLVDGCITIVVDAVADLRHSRTNHRIAVIAILETRRDAIAVRIEAVVDSAIAIIVHGVALLRGTWEHGRVRVIAI
jgi:hypothetical protein